MKDDIEIIEFSPMGKSIIKTTISRLKGEYNYDLNEKDVYSFCCDYLFSVRYKDEYITELIMYVDYNIEDGKIYLKLLADDDTELFRKKEFLDQYKYDLYELIKKETDIEEKTNMVKEVLEQGVVIKDVMIGNIKTKHQNVLHVKTKVSDDYSISYDFADGKFLFYWILPKEGQKIFMSRQNISEDDVKDKLNEHEEFQKYVNECKKNLNN